MDLIDPKQILKINAPLKRAQALNAAWETYSSFVKDSLDNDSTQAFMNRFDKKTHDGLVRGGWEKIRKKDNASYENIMGGLNAGGFDPDRLHTN